MSNIEPIMDKAFKDNLRHCLERHLKKEDAKIIAEDIVPILKKQAWKFSNRAVELQQEYARGRKAHQKAIEAERGKA